MPWYAWYYSRARVPEDTIAKITDSIPNRLDLFTELFTSGELLHAMEQQANTTSKGEERVEPHIIGGMAYMKRL